MHYICIVKRLFSYGCIIIALLIAVASFNMSEKQLINNNSNTGTIELVDNIFYISSSVLPSNFIATTNSNIVIAPETCTTLQSSPTNLLLILRSIKLDKRKYQTSAIAFISHYELKQKKGYYLYHLRKLLL